MLRFFPMPPIRTLRILSQQEINNQLVASGFQPDSVISSADLRDLSIVLGIDEAMEGTAKRTAQGVEARAKFYFGGNIAAPEVLPVVWRNSRLPRPGWRRHPPAVRPASHQRHQPPPCRWEDRPAEGRRHRNW